ncbi:restriction endonuclease [Burkholderia gladioli]|uniref:restriction endonuclease n=1 Tax=Burkholderia gladioli TaxID=28095 RepID=UPI002FE28614
MTAETTREQSATKERLRLGRALRSGHLVFDSEEKVLHVVHDGMALHSISYASLSPSQWGYVYERHVGLQFESEGYAVTYRGLQFGFVDNGVDLILERDGETIYVQCKYTLGKRISANEVRWILHKADAYLAKQYQGRRLHFHLVVPDSKRCFSSVKLRLNGVVKKHSTARYFEEHNNLQNRVRLKVVEVPMRGHSHETPLVSAG